jgi:HEAT repeat protein
MRKQRLVTALALFLGITLFLALAAYLSTRAKHAVNEQTYLGHPVSYWRDQLQKRSVSARFIPEDCPLCRDRDPQAIPVLVDLLHDQDQLVRARSAYCLGLLGPKAKPAVPALTAPLRDGSWVVRREAAHALEATGPEGADAVPALVETLDDTEPVVRCFAARALWRVSGESEKPVRTLVALVNSPDRTPEGSSRRLQAIEALGEMGPDAALAIPALISALHDKENPSNGIPGGAAEALGRIGPRAQGAEAALTALLDDEGSYVRVKAAQALWRILRRSDPSVRVLMEVLKNRECDVFQRTLAVRALAEIGAEARTAVPTLEAAVGDPNQEISSAAREALERIERRKRD